MPEYLGLSTDILLIAWRICLDSCHSWESCLSVKSTDIFAMQLQLSASIALHRQPRSQALGTSLGTWMWATGGPGLVGPWPGRTGLWGAGVQLCRGVSGAGADGSGGLTWGAGLWAAVAIAVRLCRDKNTCKYLPGSRTLLWDCLSVKNFWKKFTLEIWAHQHLHFWG